MKKRIILIGLVFITLLLGCEIATTGEAITSADEYLVAHYKFNEGSDTILKDSAGNNDGTIRGGTWVDQSECISGSCIDFDGINDYIDCGNDNSLDLTEDFTICLWIKPEFLSAANKVLTQKSRYTKDGYALWIRNNKIIINTNNASGYSFYAGTYEFSLNEWVHICGIREGTTGHIYVNGTEIPGQGKLTRLSSSSTRNFQIVGPRGRFNGTIDEVKIYDRALTTGEIRGEYENSIFEPCVDSDDGEDYSVKGTTSGYMWYDKKNEDYLVLKDHCCEVCDGAHPVESANKISEFSCTSDGKMSGIVDVCPNGCENGACIRN